MSTATTIRTLRAWAELVEAGPLGDFVRSDLAAILRDAATTLAELDQATRLVRVDNGTIVGAVVQAPSGWWHACLKLSGGPFKSRGDAEDRVVELVTASGGSPVAATGLSRREPVRPAPGEASAGVAATAPAQGLPLFGVIGLRVMDAGR